MFTALCKFIWADLNTFVFLLRVEAIHYRTFSSYEDSVLKCAEMMIKMISKYHFNQIELRHRSYRWLQSRFLRPLRVGPNLFLYFTQALWRTPLNNINRFKRPSLVDPDSFLYYTQVSWQTPVNKTWRSDLKVVLIKRGLLYQRS